MKYTPSVAFVGVIIVFLALAALITSNLPGVRRQPCPDEPRSAQAEPFVVIATQELPKYTTVQIIECRATGERFLITTRSNVVSVVQIVSGKVQP